MNTLDCKKPELCVPEVIEPSHPEPSEAFDFCVGDYSISWDGYNLRRTRVRTTIDGTYDTVSVVDGCIVEYGQGTVPTYTPPYCNPAPVPCGEGEATGTSVTISPSIGNQLTADSLGLYSRAYITSSPTVTVSGDGTQANPFVLTASENTVTTVSGSGAVNVEEIIPNSYRVTLKPSGVVPGSYHGFQISEEGLVTEFIDGEVSYIDNVNAGLEVEVSVTNGTLSVGHAMVPLANSIYQLGGYNATISPAGHITNMERVNVVTSGVYDLGAYKVSIDPYGSVSSIIQSEVPSSAGAFSTVDGKYVSYDSTGRIVDVVDEPPPTGQNPMPHTPITDVYELTVAFSGENTVLVGKNTADYTDVKVFGNPLTNAGGTISGTSATLRLGLPYYITATEQVQITEVESISVTSTSVANGILTITVSTVASAPDNIPHIAANSTIRFVLRV